MAGSEEERHCRFNSDVSARSPVLDTQPPSEDDDDSSSSGSESDLPRRTPSMNEAAEKVMKSFNAPAKWMLAAGAVLAICAGMVNTVSLLAFTSVVSHMTGHLTAIGLRIEGVRIKHSLSQWEIEDLWESKLTRESHEMHLSMLWESFMILVSFIFGSFLCGLVIPKNAVHFGGRSFYGTALMMNCILVFSGAFLGMYGHKSYAMAFLACGCGLQNAMCTMHLGAVVRTTHVTGTATDIGSTMGRATMILMRARCQRRRMKYIDELEFNVDVAKMKVLMILMFSFLVGCYIGAFGYNIIGLKMLFVPGTITGLMGVVYQFFRETLKRTYKQWQVSRIEAEMQFVDAMRHEHDHHHHHHHHEHSLEEEEEVEHTLDMLHEIQQEICEWAQSPASKSTSRSEDLGMRTRTLPSRTRRGRSDSDPERPLPGRSVQSARAVM